MQCTVDDIKALVQTKGVSQTIVGVSEYILDAYKNWNAFSKQERIATYTQYGPLELMPISNDEFYGFKYVNCHKDNPLTNLLSVVGLGVLSSTKTGYPILITEMTILTAIRTAATSALVGKYLNPTGAKSMALIGNGAQCEFQAIAFKEICGIQTLFLYDIDQNASQKVQNNLKEFGFDIHVCDSIEDAVRNADVITTCTNVDKHACLIPDHLLIKPVHINAIGGDRPGKTELDVNTLKRADIYVEFEPQTRVEGEIQQCPECVVTEIERIFTTSKTETCTEVNKASSDKKITIFDSVGFAIEDFSVLRYVKDCFPKNEKDSNFIPHPDNPKDLWSVLR